MPANVFTIEDLSFSYGDRPVFNGLNLAFPAGAVTTVIGANGSGKSTLFGLMSKNLTPDAGRIMLRQASVADVRLRDFARLVALVHQRNTMPAGVTVERLVGFGRTAYRRMGRSALSGEDERMVSWALTTCGLAAEASVEAASLSGGQAQRAWIAMALAQGASVLLLDEPTTYLDIRYQREVLRLVRRLNREHGMTVIMVLHDINQAMRYSDEVVALAAGRPPVQGPPEQVLTSAVLQEVYGVDLPVVEVDGRRFVMTA